MHFSTFNIIVSIPNKSDEYLLYNSISNLLIKIDQETKDILENNLIDNIPKDLISFLEEKRVLIKENFAFDYFQQSHMRSKHSKEESHFLIYLNSTCNLSCPNCPPHQDIIMDQKIVKNTIDFIKKQTIENNSSRVVISLFGKEPLLNYENCIKILSRIRNFAEEQKIKYHSILRTNGTLLTEKMIKELNPLVSSYYIVIDGNREIHNKKRKDSYDNILYLIKKLVTAEKYVGLQYHIDKETINTISLFLTDLSSIKILDNIYLKLNFSPLEPPYPCFFYKEENELLEVGLNNLQWIINSKKNNLEKYIDSSLMLSNQFLACSFIKEGSYVIDPTGNLFLCPVYLNLDNRIGIIKENGKINWTDTYNTLINRNPLSMECKICNYILHCAGGCPMKAKVIFNDYNKSYCGVTKELMNKRILLKYSMSGVK